MSTKHFRWLKLWNEAPDDPKFIAAADIAGSSPANAWYAWSKSLTYANENDPRGSITGLHPQVIASYCRITAEEVKRIFEAFRELRMLIGDRIANWAKRQTEKVLAKVRSAGAERVARCRAKKAAAAAQGNFEFSGSAVTPEPASVTGVTPLQTGVTAAAEEEEDFNSEAIASESARACAVVVQIKDHQKEKKADRAQRRSRLPADWRPDDQDRQFAFGKGYDDAWIEEQAAACVDYSLAHGKAYFDFHAYWRTWVNNAPRFGNAARSPAGRRSEPPSLIAAACAALAFGDVDPFEH